mgnify:CR=1 FL=1
MNIVLILGTARAKRRSEAVAKVIESKLTAAGHEVSFVDVRAHVTSAVTVPPWGEGGADEVPTAWSNIAQQAEVFIHVLPEYNRGYPGEWKLLVDSTNLNHFADKPAYLVGVSNGVFGGARVVEHVQPVLWELGQKLSGVLYISQAGKVFDTEGHITDEQTMKRVDEFIAKV